MKDKDTWIKTNCHDINLNSRKSKTVPGLWQHKKDTERKMKEAVKEREHEREISKTNPTVME